MSFDSWGEADEEQFQANVSGMEDVDGLGEAFKTSVIESLEAGPAAALYRFGRNQFEEKSLTGLEANQKYNLTNTTKAYKPEDKVSDFEARLAADRHYERMLNEQTMANVSEKNPIIGNATMFAGSLAGGFIDPVNIAVGGSTAALAKSFGHLYIPQAMQKMVAANPMAESVVRNFADNLVSSAAVDMIAVPLGETVTREETSTYQRVMNVVGGTLFGTTMGVGMDAVAIRSARKLATTKSKAHGSKTPQILEESNDHALKNYANGKKPNPEFIEEKYNIIHNTERPDQIPYQQQDITSQSLPDTALFVGKSADATELDQVTFGGETGLVVSDNPNLVSNRVTPLDGSSKGQVQAVHIKKDAKVLTNDVFEAPEVRTDVADNVAATLEEHGYSGDMNKFKTQMSEALEDADTLDDFVDILDDVLDDFEGIPEANDLMNMALSKSGFDGRHTALGEQGNGVVLFKNSDGSIKGLDQFSDPWETEFNPDHPDSAKVLDKLRKHNEAEINRTNDIEQDVDYDAEAVSAGDNALDPFDESFDELDAVLAEVGLDKSQIEELGLSKDLMEDVNALQTPDAHYSSGKALLKCIRERLK